MDIHRVAHDLRRNEGVDELLHGDGVDQSDNGNKRTRENTHDCRHAAAQPRAYNGNDIQQTSNDTQSRCAGDAHNGKTNTAANTDKQALDQRTLDIATHNAGTREIDYV